MKTIQHPLVIELDQDLLDLNRQLPEYLRNKLGFSPSRASRFRWITRGINGIPLPTIKIGSKRYTSKEALGWWFQAIAAYRIHDQATSSQRKVQIEQAAQRLRVQLGSC